ncbi:MAG TPA: c-type cytochrome [Blastocatellia bacterium]|nr:c-type cytochrome [Blastocatellia bacterium]HMX28431.1 c-type cytochrome [Blastocatellia bacterium]HMZ20983.1 c-type cytochrome [Blastocatellia bacterium]HNG30929.1 c-type cytochrome [Blastocatellia bacterium]
MLRSCVQAKLWLLCLLSLGLLMVSSCQSSVPVADNTPSLTDCERDGLIGNVKAALTADIVLLEQNGQWWEGQQASSTTVYDAAGKRISQTPFRVAMLNGFAITQHESFFDPAGKGLFNLDSATKKYVQYDGKGNVVEKGSQVNGQKIAELSVQYEFDARGNWIKRSISRLAAKDGKQVLLPAEVSRRYLVYFDSVAQPKAISASAETRQLKAPMAATPETLDAGKAQFLQRCAACHGENGKAQTDFAAAMPTKPADLTDSKIGALKEAEIYSFVSDGINAGGMPAFKGRISDDAIWQIALFVKQLSHSPNKDSTSQIAKASPTPKPSAADEAERRYSLTGKVVSIEPERKQVVIEHEEVKGYMEAMTMPFTLPDEKALGRLKKGDRIQATLVVGIGYWRLENVVVK